MRREIFENTVPGKSCKSNIMLINVSSQGTHWQKLNSCALGVTIVGNISALMILVFRNLDILNTRFHIEP